MQRVKTALTAGERIKVAYLHLIRGQLQQDLAVAYEVNHGRVNEAVQAIAFAANNPKAVLELIEQQKK